MVIRCYSKKWSALAHNCGLLQKSKLVLRFSIPICSVVGIINWMRAVVADNLEMNSRSVVCKTRSRHVVCNSTFRELPSTCHAGTSNFQCCCLVASGNTRSTNFFYTFKRKPRVFCCCLFVNIFFTRLH